MRPIQLLVATGVTLGLSSSTLCAQAGQVFGRQPTYREVSARDGVQAVDASWADNLQAAIDEFITKLKELPPAPPDGGLLASSNKFLSVARATMIRREPSLDMLDALRRAMRIVQATNLDDASGREDILPKLSDVRKLLNGPRPGVSWLPQSAISYVNDATPKANVTAAVYYAYVTEKKFIPIILGASLPSLSDSTLDAAISNVLDEYGGLLNLSIEKGGKIRWKPLDWFPTYETLGLFWNGRAGARGVEAQGVSDLTSLNVFGTGVGTVRYAFPISLSADPKYNEGHNAGMVIFTANLNGQTAPNTNYLRLPVTDTVPKNFMHLNLHLSAYITDLFYVNAGMTAWSSSDALKDRIYVSLSRNNEGTRARSR